MTSSERDFDYYYPFLDLTTQVRMTDKQWTLTKKDNEFTLSTTLDQRLMQRMEQYDFESATESAEISVFRDGVPYSFQSPIDVEFVKDSLHMYFNEYRLVQFDPDKAIFQPCGPAGGKNKKEVSYNELTVLSSGGSTMCFQFEAPDLEQKYGYIINVETENKEGRPLYFYALDRTKVQSFLEDRLVDNNSLFIINPKYEYGVGYNFTFQNTSYSHIDAVNTLKNLWVYYLPYSDIKNARFVKQDIAPVNQQYRTDYSANQLNYYTYTVTLPEVSNRRTLVLYKQFEEGWKAYTVPDTSFVSILLPFVTGKELSTHVSINNWANGWTLDTDNANSTIIIVFWPQYLQYAGYVVLLFLFIIAAVLLTRKKLHS